jgi:hypothetical protein
VASREQLSSLLPCMELSSAGGRRQRLRFQANAQAETVTGIAARLGRGAHAVPMQDAATGQAGGAATRRPVRVPA